LALTTLTLTTPREIFIDPIVTVIVEVVADLLHRRASITVSPPSLLADLLPSPAAALAATAQALIHMPITVIIPSVADLHLRAGSVTLHPAPSTTGRLTIATGA